MATEKAKMLAGELYDSADPENPAVIRGSPDGAIPANHASSL